MCMHCTGVAEQCWRSKPNRQSVPAALSSLNALTAAGTLSVLPMYGIVSTNVFFWFCELNFSWTLVTHPVLSSSCACQTAQCWLPALGSHTVFTGALGTPLDPCLCSAAANMPCLAAGLHKSSCD